jgi:hypothetical protein
MKTTGLDLLTEINVMRGMMGLNEKQIITEQLAPIISAFGRSSAKFIGKAADEIAKTLKISLAKAKVLKAEFDNLASAIKSADNVLAKEALTKIFANTDASFLTKYVDDIMSDVTDDALVPSLVKRAKALKARGGAADNVIKDQLIKDIDDALEGLPDSVKTAIKNKVDDIYRTAMSGVASASKQLVTTDNILARLSQEQAWADLSSKFPELKQVFISRIDDIIAGGAKTEEEVFSVILGQVKSKLKPSTWNRFLALKAKNPKYFKIAIYVASIGVISVAVGKSSVASKIGVWICEKLFFGKNDPWCQYMFSSEYEESDENDENETTNKKCDKTLNDFVAWAKGQFGAGGDPTFDESTCTGTVYGDKYKWNGSNWV